jgi:hypothetical protein
MAAAPVMGMGILLLETVRKVFLTFLYNMYARAWKNKKNVPHYAERDQIFEKRSHKHNGARHGT